MKNLLFPGWASFESFYKKELAEDFVYCEKNVEYNEEVNIVAWSMGTLTALDYIKKHKVNKLILLAPTADFTKTTDISLIENMIMGIKKNKIETLNNFYRLNFSKNSDFYDFKEEYERDIELLNESKLVEGLEYLRDKKVMNYDFKNVRNLYVITGKRDKVINWENNKEFALFGKHIEYNLGHNFIYKNEALRDLVRSILGDKKRTGEEKFL